MTAGLESLVPDVIPSQPQQQLQVSYEDGIHVTPGLALRPRQVRHAPTVEWDSQPDKLYTLMMVDPDAPSRQNPVRRDCLHWLVFDIPGGDIAKGEIKAEYIGSAPPQGSGLHRYVFLICQQSGRLNLDAMESVSKTQIIPRVSFRTRQFLESQNLHLVAANYYQAEWDDYVPELHAQFGLKPTP